MGIDVDIVEIFLNDGADLLTTGELFSEGGSSCLLYAVFDSHDTAVLELLLNTAEERGQLSELLAITTEFGKSVFHEVANTEQLQILVEAGTRCKQRTAQAVRDGLPHFPDAIADLVLGFLPDPLASVNQKLCGGTTPLMLAVRDGDVH